MAIHPKPILAVIAFVVIAGLLFPSIYHSAKAQNIITFTPADKFSIPALNGSISFLTNGTCSEATFENNTWNFKDLALNRSRPAGDLKISAENSNITLTSYWTLNGTFSGTGIVYLVEGQGRQTIDFGIDEPTRPDEWSVTVPGSIFLAEGDGWTLFPDNTVEVYRAASRIAVLHYVLNYPSDENLPFYQRHSVAIGTAVLVAVTVAVAVLIKVKGGKVD